MRQFAALLASEVRTQMRKTGTHAFAAMYAALGVFIMVAIGGAFKGVQIGIGAGNVNVDSPRTIAVLSLVLSLFATMNVAAISGNAACRDVEEGMHPLVYTTPVPKWAFLGSRWLGSLIASAWVVAGIPAGLMLGALLPVLETERVGSWALMSGVVAMVGWILPNLVFCSGLFFGIAALTRRMFPNYVGGVVLLVGYLGSQAITADLDNKTLAVMIDPFGLEAFSELTEYWSPHDRNVRTVWPEGISLANRVLWTAVGLGALGAGAGLSRLDQDGWSFSLRRRRKPVESEAFDRTLAELPVPVVARRFDGRARAAQLWALGGRAVRDVLGHRYFWAFVSAAVLFQLLNAQVVGAVYGTNTWPVTYEVIEVLNGTLQLFLLVVVTFYAGDLVWHERDLGTASLYDSLPMPDALPLLAKTAALFAVVLGMHLTVIVMGVGVQLWSGYTHLEPSLYVQDVLVFSVIGWLPWLVLAIAVHAVINHKVLGHLVLIAYYVLQDFRVAAGFEYNLPWFGSDPGLTYSDMNGWGWFLQPFLVYRAYWLAVALVLLGASRLAWVRGTDPGLRHRWHEARRRLDRPTVGVLAVGLAVGAALAMLIFVNTNVRRPYRNTKSETQDQVDYELRYKPDWDTAPHPRITTVDLDVDLYPSTGVVHAAGTATLVNREAVPVARMLVSVDRDAEVADLSLDRPFTVGARDEALGLQIWTLDPPMQPGETAALRWDLTEPDRGFPNNGANTVVVGNGTFVHSGLVVPSLGYDRNMELSEKSERRKYDLPERPRMADLDDPAARGHSYLARDADRVALTARVTTEAGQIPLAPGAQVDQGTDGDRVWAEFRTVEPIWHFYSFLSAAWSVQRDRWNDVGIEVYYHPTHHYNVDRMIEGVKESLTLYTAAFGPYQYGEIRIVEFPRYATFAQSFPSTIPFSEAIGFIARIDDPDEDIDYPYYVTAHEVGHQWWAHQVIGADAQGGTVLSETLAQYSALKVMHATYGDDQIHRFLRYEADQYFRGRATERDKEVPLLRVENQGYIHYNKGGIVMWELAHEFGEDRVDAALRAFLETWRPTSGPPYPTARDLLAELRVHLPDAEQRLTDGFEKIVLYENRATAATATKNPDGTWTVHVEIALAKTESDALGEEAEVPFSEPIEVGVFSGTKKARKTLYLQPQVLAGPTAAVDVVVSEEPTLAGIDPNLLLLDRDRDDNVIPVER